jgi:predicted dehydrogenase
VSARIDRRGFLGTALAGPLVLPPWSALGYAANERVNLAVMGTMYVADHFFTSVHAYPGVEIVALCNPDGRKTPERFAAWKEQAKKLAASERAEDKKTAERYARLAGDARPRTFLDFRKLLDEMGKGIDAVVVSMFDHYHGPACGAAMRAGKHVFSERPLGLTIRESRALRELAARQKVATSIRNPGNASHQFRRAVELVRDGALGEVTEVHVWFDRAGPDRKERPQGTPAVPDGLDWDLWLGPVAERPYHPDWMAYATWRETSNGGIGTFGPHAANLAFLALNVADLWHPGQKRAIKVRAESSGLNQLSFPKWERVRWAVPARGDRRPVTFTWHHGADFGPGSRQLLEGMLAERGVPQAERGKLLGYAGALLVGSKGSLVADDHNVKVTLLPAEQFRDVNLDKPKSPSRGHYHDWFHAIRGGEPAWANFGYAGPLSEFLMLGNVATRFGAELEYDPAAGTIVNNPAADQLLGYEYRKGWTL